jgi:hypothetical protein
LSIRSKHNCKYKHFETTSTSAKNKNKHDTKLAAACQLIQENDVCECLTLYAREVKDVVNHAGYNIDVGLEFEEVKDNNTNRILAKLDPLTAEFVQALRKKVKFANSKMLKSFRLKLCLDEKVTA